MSKITGIYKIESPPGRIYIGQAVDITRRFKEYKNIKKSKLQIKLNRSFNKYGIENHKFEILEECDTLLLNDKERYYQDFYNVVTDGLNCTLVQSTYSSGELSQETKNKISLANTGRVHSEKVRQSMGFKNIGKVASEETRKKMSNSRKGRKISEEWRNNISKGNVNKPKSQEAIKKMRIAKLGIPNYKLQKKVIDTKSGIIYNSIKEVSEIFSIKYQTLGSWLRNEVKNKSNFKLYYDK
jgi:group I intron endonuclease